ncbi:hypothetical protein TNCV_133751 [Trichonephila clavipes]|nr:hypothetical protein TNCV_133751 [Trichonephila clavipes]
MQHNGSGSRMVMGSDRGWPCPEFEPRRCTLNLSRAEKSSRWCGVVVRRGLWQHKNCFYSSCISSQATRLRGPISLISPPRWTSRNHGSLARKWQLLNHYGQSLRSIERTPVQVKVYRVRVPPTFTLPLCLLLLLHYRKTAYGQLVDGRVAWLIHQSV